jgi:amino acid adenylation domain-containing protein
MNMPSIVPVIAETFVGKMIASQARSAPDHPAIIAQSTTSYSQLETQSNRLAHCLLGAGIGPGSVVAICLERSPTFIVTALAVMKIGAAYLPLNPADPAERLRFIRRDCGAVLVICAPQTAAHFPDTQTIILEDGAPSCDATAPEPPHTQPAADDLAYVIYTSGSTGQPKGVEITHRNMANLIAWHVRAFSADENTRATFQAGIGFDAAVWEIWPHLAAGGTLLLPDDDLRVSPIKLRDWLVAQRITISFIPTAIAEQLIALSWPRETSLRFLLTGADTLHRFPAANLPFPLVNNYGPTECTVVATSGVVPVRTPASAPPQRPSIGRPIDNVRIHIVDQQFGEAESGEICIAGAGVARGYRNRPDLTEQRFILLNGERVYRTGDLGRRLANGEIEFLGRIDEQVKIRGHRIELGEITAVLNEQRGVQAAVVIARDEQLIAYVVGDANEEQLRQILQQRLPNYMQPAAFVRLASLPLNANGKIDRAALPQPSAVSSEEFIAPRNTIEETVGGIIQQVLRVPRVSVNDDFFRMGAHSLFGAQVIAHVGSIFGAELKLLDVFEAPTVAQLSARIEEALTRKVNAMSEAEIGAALAGLEQNASR